VNSTSGGIECSRRRIVSSTERHDVVELAFSIHHRDVPTSEGLGVCRVRAEHLRTRRDGCDAAGRE
jgi:hypothetical protein